MKATLVKNKIHVTFSFDEVTLAKVKTLEGREWSREGRRWVAPVTASNIKLLRGWGFLTSKELNTWLTEHSELPELDLSRYPLNPAFKHLTPHKYQVTGIRLMFSKKGRALLADDPGLGKTMMSFICTNELKAYPVLIICPSTAKYTWRREAIKWLNEKNKNIDVMSGRYSVDNMLLDKKITIINYDVLSVSYPCFCTDDKRKSCRKCKGTGKVHHLRPDLQDKEFGMVLIDECHMIKNPKAVRTRVIKELCACIKRVIPMSGTPFLSSPIEMFTAVNIVHPGLFGNWFTFAQKYCGPTFNGFAWDYSGSSNTKQLHRILTDTIMIRRTKQQVHEDLPDKVRSVVPLDIDNRKEYSEARKDVISWLDNKYGEEVAERGERSKSFAKIHTLQSLAARGKINQVVEWVKTFLTTKEKLIVFCTSKMMLRRLNRVFAKTCVTIDGDVPSKKRDELVQQFQNDPYTLLFIGNIQAAGINITLSASSHVAFAEMGWTPGGMVQAEDRAYGRADNPHGANIYYLVAQDTIEEDIAETLDAKARTFSLVIDGEEVDEQGMLTTLIERMKGK